MVTAKLESHAGKVLGEQACRTVRIEQTLQADWRRCSWRGAGFERVVVHPSTPNCRSGCTLRLLCVFRVTWRAVGNWANMVYAASCLNELAVFP